MIGFDTAILHAIAHFARSTGRGADELSAEGCGDWEEGWCFKCRMANKPFPENAIYGVWPVFINRLDGRAIELSPKKGVDEIRALLRSDETA